MTDYDSCRHETAAEEGVEVLWRVGYQGSEWLVFKCPDCGDACLSTKEGLEKRGVVSTRKGKEIIATMMPDSTVPDEVR